MIDSDNVLYDLKSLLFSAAAAAAVCLFISCNTYICYIDTCKCFASISASLQCHALK